MDGSVKISTSTNDEAEEVNAQADRIAGCLGEKLAGLEIEIPEYPKKEVEIPGKACNWAVVSKQDELLGLFLGVEEASAQKGTLVAINEQCAEDLLARQPEHFVACSADHPACVCPRGDDGETHYVFEADATRAVRFIHTSCPLHDALQEAMDRGVPASVSRTEPFTVGIGL